MESSKTPSSKLVENVRNKVETEQTRGSNDHKQCTSVDHPDDSVVHADAQESFPTRIEAELGKLLSAISETQLSPEKLKALVAILGQTGKSPKKKIRTTDRESTSTETTEVHTSKYLLKENNNEIVKVKQNPQQIDGFGAEGTNDESSVGPEPQSRNNKEKLEIINVEDSDGSVSPKPAPRLRINRRENSPKPAPRRCKTGTDVEDGGEKYLPEEKKAESDLNSLPLGTRNDEKKKEGILKDMAVMPKSILSPKKTRTDGYSVGSPKKFQTGGRRKSGHKSPRRKKSSSIYDEQSLLGVLENKEGRSIDAVEESPAKSPGIGTESKENRRNQTLRRKETIRKQQQDAEQSKLIFEAEREVGDVGVNDSIQLEVEGAFVKTEGEEKSTSLRSPRKVLRDVKRRLSVRKSSIKRRSLPAEVLGEVEDQMRKDERRTKGLSMPDSPTMRRITKVRRALSQRISNTVGRKPVDSYRAPFLYDAKSGTKKEQEWHVSDDVILNFHTHRQRIASNNDSISEAKSLTMPRKRFAPEKILANKTTIKSSGPKLLRNSHTLKSSKHRIRSSSEARRTKKLAKGTSFTVGPASNIRPLSDLSHTLQTRFNELNISNQTTGAGGSMLGASWMGLNQKSRWRTLQERNFIKRNRFDIFDDHMQ